MIVDLEEKEEKDERGWFDLEGGGKVELRLLTAKDLKDLRAACMTIKVEYPLLDIDPENPKKGKQYRRFEAPQFNAELWEEMLTDRTILGWEDLSDRNKKTIPVTKENKLLLLQRVPVFKAAYDAGLKILKQRDEERTRQAEKNSLIGSVLPTVKAETE